MINAVQFDFFGKPRKLRFDSNAICDLEDAGVNVIGFIAQVAQAYLANDIQGCLQLMGGVKFLRLYLYHGLKWEDGSLTLLKVGNWIDTATTEGGAQLATLWERVITALWETELVKNFMRQIENEANKKPEGEANPNE